MILPKQRQQHQKQVKAGAHSYMATHACAFYCYSSLISFCSCFFCCWCFLIVLFSLFNVHLLLVTTLQNTCECVHVLRLCDAINDLLNYSSHSRAFSSANIDICALLFAKDFQFHFFPKLLLLFCHYGSVPFELAEKIMHIWIGRYCCRFHLYKLLTVPPCECVCVFV